MDNKGEYIFWSEFEKMVKHIQNNKASGIDKISVELIKSSGQDMKNK